MNYPVQEKKYQQEINEESKYLLERIGRFQKEFGTMLAHMREINYLDKQCINQAGNRLDEAAMWARRAVDNPDKP